jgi:RHS repeat-associated protein
VLEVITDRKLPVEGTTGSGGYVDYFLADVVSYSDYYPYGMLMPNRHGSVGDYRYGFNGMEADDEVKSLKGTSYDFGARMYDPRVGRWLSLDPRKCRFPNLSPYHGIGNNPILYIDFEGEIFGVGRGTVDVKRDSEGKLVLTFSDKVKQKEKDYYLATMLPVFELLNESEVGYAVIKDGNEMETLWSISAVDKFNKEAYAHTYPGFDSDPKNGILDDASTTIFLQTMAAGIVRDESDAAEIYAGVMAVELAHIKPEIGTQKGSGSPEKGGYAPIANVFADARRAYKAEKGQSLNGTEFGILNSKNNKGEHYFTWDQWSEDNKNAYLEFIKSDWNNMDEAQQHDFTNYTGESFDEK